MSKYTRNYLYQKTVIITGASGGLGFGIAKKLIEYYDCKIIGIARNEKKLIAAIETLGDKKSNFTYRIFDVSVKENWQNFANDLANSGIVVDVLINNAGFMLPFAKYEKYSYEEIDEIINTNLKSCLYSIKELMPILNKSKTPSIVNIASAAGLCSVVGESMYSATKFAVHGFTQALRQEYKGKMYIGGVYPGFIKTDILQRMDINDKNNRLISKMMKPLHKAVNIIVKGIAKKKGRIVLGFDGRSMDFFGRRMPKATPSIITAVLKKSGLEMFKDVFED
jgi:short-subunit dehydrogenase